MNIRALFLALTFCVASTSYADRVFVERASGSAPESDLGIATDLVRGTVTAEGKHTVVGDSAQSEVVLRPRLMKLGASYVLSVEKVKAKDVVFSAQMKAAQIEELDRVAARVTRAALAEVAPEGDARVGDVTDHEAREGTNRKQALKGYYFGIGPTVLSSLSSQGIGYYFDGGYAFDLSSFSAKIALDIGVNGGASLSTLTLGGAYMFSQNATSPYASLAFGLGTAKDASSSFFSSTYTTGFAVGVGGGIQMLRTSSFQIDLGVQAMFLLKDANPSLVAARVNFYIL